MTEYHEIQVGHAVKLGIYCKITLDSVLTTKFPN